MTVQPPSAALAHLRAGGLRSGRRPRTCGTMPLCLTYSVERRQTQRRSRARCGQLFDDDACQGFFEQHAVMPVGAGDHQGHRLSVAIRETAALDAPFAATGRIRADFFPARRRSVHAVNPSLPAPVNLLESFTREKPFEPEALEDTCLSSIVKPPYGLTGANTIRLHLAWTSCRPVSG